MSASRSDSESSVSRMIAGMVASPARLAAQSRRSPATSS